MVLHLFPYSLGEVSFNWYVNLPLGCVGHWTLLKIILGTIHNFLKPKYDTSPININQKGPNQNSFMLQPSVSYGIPQVGNAKHYTSWSHNLDLSKFYGPYYYYFPKKISYDKYQKIWQSLLRSNYLYKAGQS